MLLTKLLANASAGGEADTPWAAETARTGAAEASPELTNWGSVRSQFTLDKSRIHAVHLGGKRMELPERDYNPREVTDAALVNWSDVYTQARVAELRRDTALRRAAE